MSAIDRPEAAEPSVSDRQALVLLVSILVVALCGIVYELIIAAISSYLLGDSVYQFSLTIGFFMFAMGIGSYLSQFVMERLVQNFVVVEIALALVGGLCGLTLFLFFPLAPELFQAAQFFFILVIGTLVGLEIPLLTRALSDQRGARRSLAQVLSIDYVGALVGSVAFPLLLLPSLGLLSASFAIGLLNASVALVNIVYLRAHLPNYRLLLSVALAALALLIALTVLGQRITAYAQHHLYLDQVVYREDSPYQQVVLTQDVRKGDLRMFIDGHLQFSEHDEHRYHEMLTHSALAAPGPRARILVMGGGDGLAVREILKYPDVKEVVVVDLDPAITRLAREFAPLRRLNQASFDDPRVRVVNADAFVFLRDGEDRYDRMILDFPDPHNEALSKLYSVEFYAAARARLSPDGALITQSSSPYFAQRTFWSITTTLEAVFPEVTPLQTPIPSFGVWGFNLARATSAGAPEPVSATRYFDAAALRAARIIPRDIARPEDGLRANSIFEPTLYRVYLEDKVGRLSQPLAVDPS